MKNIIWAGLWVACCLYFPNNGQAANPDGALRIEVIAAPNFVVDSNIQTPAGQSPRAAYLGARFYNDGATELTNIFAYIGNYAGGVGSTPGLYPSRAHPGLTGPLPGGEFALVHEGGSAGLSDATRFIRSIPAGEFVTIYWLISYPLLDTLNVPVFLSGPDYTDDLWLNYDIWATARQGGTTLTADQTTRATMRNEISAMANKIFPNTANQVPQEYQDLLQQYMPIWTNIQADGSVGTKIHVEGIWYMLGNVGEGYDADGDFVYDRDAWLQPIGNPELYDAGYFRLARTETMLVVQLKNGGEQVILAEDQLYFKDIPENNSVVGFVMYSFVPLQPGGAAQLTPYQEAASGRDNEKFNSDYGATIGSGLISLEAEATVEKGVSLSNAVPGATLTYSLVYSNSSASALGDPEVGLAVVIQDRIPSGTHYESGTATSSNTLPAGVTGYSVLFSTNNGVSWTAVEPADPTLVTDIQWWLDAPLGTNTGATITFSVAVNNPYTNAPRICNTAEVGLGNNPPFTSDRVCTLVSGNNELGDRVFADDGSGGGVLGNQLQESGEPGLSNILVTLYYDSNGNGLLDAQDTRITSTRTDTNGYYIFTNLMDGAYLSVVDGFDTNLPSGYTLSTPGLFVVALDTARIDPNPVSVLTADFGFLPALTLTKKLVDAGPVYEGRLVRYTVTVSNNIPGTGTGQDEPRRFQVWGRAIDAANSGTIAGDSWVNPSNAASPYERDGLYATGPMRGSPELMAITDFNLPAQAGSVTNVKIQVPIVLDPLSGGFNALDSLWVKILDRSAPASPLFSTNILVSALSSGMLTFDVTALRAWTWSDFTTNYSIQLITDAKNAAVAKTGVILAEAAGFLITSDQIGGAGSGTTTLDPVPLEDYYNTNELEFVSAWPMPDGFATNAPFRILRWSNVGPLYPGGYRTIPLTFKALEPAVASGADVTNTVMVTNAFFSSGIPANAATNWVVTNLVATGEIGDYVWFDANRNGIMETNEYGLANVTVVLRPPTNVNLGAGMGVSLTNVTDRNGYYLFTGIADTGRYVVAVLTNSLAPGASNTYTELNGTVNPTNVTTVTNLNPSALDGSDSHLTADFGYAWNGALIIGSIWNDLNRSGTSTPDAGEPWLTNVWVYLYDTDAPSVVIASNRTSTSGFFSFVGPYDGDYIVRAVTNSGQMAGSTWTASFDTDGLGSADQVTLTVATGVIARADFSYYQIGPYAIGDTLFYDWNGDGERDAKDEGIADIAVTLYLDVNSNGVVDAATDFPLAVTNTDLQGLYLFTNYPAGRYLVMVNQEDPDFPALFTITADPYGADDGIGYTVISNASDWTQDFGYQPYGFGSIGDTVWKDLNADGIQVGANETGISNVLVRLYADLNGDGDFVVVATMFTDADGHYLFTNLTAGSYRAEVERESSGIPHDVYGHHFVPTTPTMVPVTLLSGEAFLTADFGFTALGAIGDTVFWDYNANGAQDWMEPGVSGVTVNLYRDLNANGIYDAGTDLFYDSRETDGIGQYLFTGLTQGWYVVKVDLTSDPVTNAVLTAAPYLDGEPLTNAALQDYYANCGLEIFAGTAFMGADFGFQPPGVLGETVWIDLDADGVREDGEPGIPNAGVVLSSTDGVWTNYTDGDGYYGFGGLTDGVYQVSVLTNAPSFPSYLTPVYDPDGTNTPSVVSVIVISSGHVASVNGQAVTNFDLMINFGYRYAGSNALSGTVGLDGEPQDGLLGTGASGVSADEVPFAGRTVYLYVWNDANSNGVPDGGESTFISSTLTATNGDYSFTNLPSATGSGTNRYIVSVAAPQPNLYLTTTNGSTPALWVTASTNVFGENLSAYQVVAIAPVVTNIDFAYRSVYAYDFGDLPESYSTTLGNNPEGPRHRVPETPVLVLGTSVNTEPNGQPSATASLDDFDDGVTRVGVWQEGTDKGTVRVQVGDGSGWLVGYIDFNGNGSFLDAGEMVVNQAVASDGGNGSGLYTLSVTVPADAIQTSTSTVFNARFRLFPTEPVYPELAFSGAATGGEVEDYQWELGTVGDTVWVDANRNGMRDAGEAPLPNMRVYADLNSNGVWETGEPFALTDTNGVYGIGGFPAGTYRIAVDTSNLPLGLSAVYDADGGADNRADVALSEGETDLGVDFGYDYPDAAVTLVKTAGEAADGTPLVVAAGSNVVYRYRVVNAGDTYLVDLTVTDDILGAVGTVAGPLAPSAFVDLYATNLNVMAPVTNIGTVIGTPAVEDGTPIPGMDDVTDTDDAVVWLALEIRGLVWKENLGLMDGYRTNDPVFAEIPVTLFVDDTNGTWVGSTTTDVNGVYSFTNVTTGVTYMVQFAVPKGENLYKYFATTSDYVVADGPDRIPVGNDALYGHLNSNWVFGVASIGPTQIVYGSITYVDAGLGTNQTPTLSTTIELRLYETAEGLFLELRTADEVVDGVPIVIWLDRSDGTRVRVGEVLSRGGSQVYWVPVEPALFAGGGTFRLVVEDESGAFHVLPPKTVAEFKSERVLMTKEGVTLTWASIPGRVYDVYMATRLGGTWTKVAANIESDGDRCSAVVTGANGRQAFYKIVMQAP